MALISQAAYADEGKFGWLYLLVGDRDTVITVVCRQQRLDRRMQKLLPRLRADSKAEQRTVLSTLQMIAAGILPVGPTRRQIVQTAQRHRRRWRRREQSGPRT